MADVDQMKGAAKQETARNGGASGAVDPTTHGVNRFTKVVIDRPSYKVKTCLGKPLVGYLLGLGPMPPKKLTDDEKRQGQTGEWNAFVILTTEPTLAHKAGADVPEVFPPGTEVTIGESVQTVELRKILRADKMLEVRIQPIKEKAELSGGRTMRLFDIGCDYEHPVARPTKYALPAASLPPTKQMAQNASANGDDDIGF